MDEPAGVEILRRILTEGFAAGRTDVVDELTTEDMIEHQFGLVAHGESARDGLRRAMLEVHEMSSDVSYTIEDWAAHGDRVWVRAVARGTQTGPFFGPPTGRPFEITVLDVARIVDGRIAEHWGVPDRFALLVESGAIGRLKGSA